jgi:hypothetical protein
MVLVRSLALAVVAGLSLSVAIASRATAAPNCTLPERLQFLSFYGELLCRWTVPYPVGAPHTLSERLANSAVRSQPPPPRAAGWHGYIAGNWSSMASTPSVRELAGIEAAYGIPAMFEAQGVLFQPASVVNASLQGLTLRPDWQVRVVRARQRAVHLQREYPPYCAQASWAAVVGNLSAFAASGQLAGGECSVKGANCGGGGGGGRDGDELVLNSHACADGATASGCACEGCVTSTDFRVGLIPLCAPPPPPPVAQCLWATSLCGTTSRGTSWTW